jgi:hypothetical protein
MSDGKIRRSSSEWREIIKRQKASGLPRTTFCEREGIAKATFDKWKRRLSSDACAVPTSFVELRAPTELRAVPTSTPLGEFELSLPGGVVLRWKL